MLNKSPTFDEPAHLSAGYNFWLNSDYRQGTDSSVFSQKWAALPLLGMKDLQFPSQSWQGKVNFDGYGIGIPFLHELGNPTEAILFRSRAMISLLAALAGVLIFLWGYSTYGGWGGLVAQSLFVFNPMVLANGGLVTTDIPVTVWFLASIFAFWRLTKRISITQITITGIAAGLLVISKMTGLLFGPTAAILVAIRVFHPQPVHWTLWKRPARLIKKSLTKALALISASFLAAAISLGVIWVAYDLRYTRVAGVDDVNNLDILPWESNREPEGGLSPFIELSRRYSLLPQSYLLDLTRLSETLGGRPSFLFDQTNLKGWWYFFPFAFIAKSNPAALILLALALAALWIKNRKITALPSRPDRHWSMTEMIPWSVFSVLFLIAALRTPLNIGYRHILPILPFCCLYSGASIFWIGQSKAMRIFLIFVGAWLVIATLVSFPNYIAYISPILGGSSNNYNVLIDSSTDWGQELPAVKDKINHWHTVAGKKLPVYFSYFGSSRPSDYGLETQALPSFFRNDQSRFYPLRPGIYLISNTMLQTLYTRFPGEWNPSYEKLYQEIAWVPKLMKAGKKPETMNSQEWINLSTTWNELRFARLASYLRHREPDDHVNHGVQAYFLTRKELRDALQGDPIMP